MSFHVAVLSSAGVGAQVSFMWDKVYENEF